VTTGPSRARRPRRRSRRGAALGVAAAVVAFVVGIALGQALEESPPPGGTQTIVRTLNPLQLPPAARETVTVTTSAP
jgi:hypothetical protein